MERLFEDYLKLLETVFREFEQAIDGLADEGVNWSPGEGANSLAVLSAHTAGSVRYWIGDVAMNEPSGRDRKSEFRVAGVSAGECLRWLKASLVYAQGAIPRLSPSELPVTRRAPSDGRDVSVAWAVLHALEHAAMHAGHAQLTRQLWESQAPKR